MMHVRIVMRPQGTTPEWVRDAWIGLTLPTLSATPQKWRVIGATVQANRLQIIGAVLRGRTERLTGYVIPAKAALDILAETQPEAAEWWRTHATAIPGKSGALLFDVAACEHLGGTASIPPRFAHLFPASPGRIAALWGAALVLRAADIVCFGGENRSVPAALYLSCTPIFAGLIAAWLLRLRNTALHLLCALVSLDLALHLLVFVLSFVVPPAYDDTVQSIIPVGQIIGISIVIVRGFYWLSTPWRRMAAWVAAAFVIVGASSLSGLNYQLWRLSDWVRPLIGRADPEPSDQRPPDIEADRLWDAQPGLIAAQISALHPRKTGTTNFYAMAVAGSGTQDLFGREAQAALKAVARHFGASSTGGMLLSNARADQLRAPLATRANIAAATKGIGARADHAHDVLFAYLASHGSRTAELASSLPDYQSVQPISSNSLARALKDADVHRRIIVISACFAATWAPALANDNTIVIAAAAKDRTSFGCDDSREITVFGEAFLGSLASPTISLRDAFEQAKRKIAAEETRQDVTPSLPQAFVGRNMTALWLEPGGSASTD